MVRLLFNGFGAGGRNFVPILAIVSSSKDFILLGLVGFISLFLVAVCARCRPEPEALKSVRTNPAFPFRNFIPARRSGWLGPVGVSLHVFLRPSIEELQYSSTVNKTAYG